MTRLIIDTDPGVDDAFAIALAAREPGIDLLAVTTVAGNIGLDLTTRNALGVLALCDRPDVPVAAGAHRPFSRPVRGDTAHGVDGLGGAAAVLPEPSAQPDPRGAVQLMVDVLTASDEPVTIVAIGPLTNVALLLAAYPSVRQKIERLVIMGGGIAGGNITTAAEFNIWVDPEAARRVLVEEDVPTTLVPLDVTMRCSVGDDWLNRLARSGPVGSALAAITPHYRAWYAEFFGRDDFVMHDALAVAEVIQPGLLRTTPLRLEVDCSDGPSSGATLADRRGGVHQDPGRLVDVALDADPDTIRSFILERLT
ncbi:nucleoside hydrolase [Actinophytocola sp.]|uniref:nucleoside hydrolase n=1 Tax=Actinophytocola sp. TaxID=1872138 RepID=UPI002ED0268A